MSDLIDRRAVLDTIDWTRAGKAAFDAIKALPSAQPEPRWTPCSERLPEALEEVLVTSKHGYVYTSRIVHGEFEYGGEVIAWMPLPEPYKEEDE